MSDLDLTHLSQADLDLMHASLLATCDGSFFEDWEFGTLMGMERAEMRQIVEELPDASGSWPDVASTVQTTAVFNSILHLLRYPLDKRELASLESVWGIDLTLLRHLQDRLRSRAT